MKRTSIELNGIIMKRLFNISLLALTLASAQVFPADQNDQTLQNAQQLINKIGDMSFGDLHVGQMLQNLINRVQHLKTTNAELSNRNNILQARDTQRLQEIIALQNSIRRAQGVLQNALPQQQHANVLATKATSATVPSSSSLLSLSRNVTPSSTCSSSSTSASSSTSSSNNLASTITSTIDLPAAPTDQINNNQHFCRWNNCNRNFADVRTLDEHISAEHIIRGIKECQWSNCNRTFKVKRDLSEHITRKHCIYYKYICDKCDKKYKNRRGLAYHRKNKHPEQLQTAPNLSSSSSITARPTLPLPTINQSHKRTRDERDDLEEDSPRTSEPKCQRAQNNFVSSIQAAEQMQTNSTPVEDDTETDEDELIIVPNN